MFPICILIEGLLVELPCQTITVKAFKIRCQLPLTMLLNVFHDGPHQQGNLVAWLAALLHLLQRDTEHPGCAEGLAQGTREALPHCFHSHTTSVALHGQKQSHVNVTNAKKTTKTKENKAGWVRKGALQNQQPSLSCSGTRSQDMQER